MPVRLLIAFLLLALAGPAPETGQTPLGHDPLCEASAAVVAPWAPGLVVVADNEYAAKLFVFKVEGGTLVGQTPMKVPGKQRPKDVESLVVAGEQLVLVGSQSRSATCAAKPERQRIAFYRWNEPEARLRLDRAIDGSPAIAAAGRNPEGCLRALFTSPPPPLAREFCEAFAAAEAAAGKPNVPCATLNVEGAVAIPSGQGGAPRIWLGLRSPLTEGNAVLLRLVPSLGEFRFDGVAMLDLGGRGVRELALHDGALWGIAGPLEDAADGFALWRVPMTDVQPGLKGAAVSFVRDLPASAEGLVFAGGQWIVVFDVDRQGIGGACQALQLPLGTPN